MQRVVLACVILTSACSGSGGGETPITADAGDDAPIADDGTDTTLADAPFDFGAPDTAPTVIVGDGAPDTPPPPDTTPPADTGSPPVDTGSPDTTPPPDTGSLTCADDDYDVDGDPTNGCEVKDLDNNHSEASPLRFFTVGECDPYTTHDGTYPSDARTHTPSGAIGDRPDYFSWFHSSSTCGPKPILFFTLDAAGSYEISLYPSGGAPDPACTLTVTGKSAIGPIYCSPASAGVKYYWRLRKLSGPSEVAKYTLKFR